MKNRRLFLEDAAEDPVIGGEPYQDLDIVEEDEIHEAQCNARDSFGRTPTTVGNMSHEYDDLEQDDKTVPEDTQMTESQLRGIICDMLDEAVSKDPAEIRQRKRNAVLNQLAQVWASLGKVETKLGTAQFDAADANFEEIVKILGKLITDIKELMGYVERTREKTAGVIHGPGNLARIMGRSGK